MIGCWEIGYCSNPRLETHPRLDSQSDKNSNNNQQISIKSIETEIVRVSPRAALQDDTSNQSTSIDLFKSGNTEEAAV